MGQKQCNGNHDVGCRGCEDTIFFPNWFDKENCQDLIDRDISDEEFKRFINQYQDSMAEEVSDMVRCALLGFFGK